MKRRRRACQWRAAGGSPLALGAETEIAERFVKAREAYENRPVALHVRAMNMLYEAIKEKGSMVIVPSSAVETMGLGGLSGISALAKQNTPTESNGAATTAK